MMYMPAGLIRNLFEVFVVQHCPVSLLRSVESVLLATWQVVPSATAAGSLTPSVSSVPSHVLHRVVPLDDEAPFAFPHDFLGPERMHLGQTW